MNVQEFTEWTPEMNIGIDEIDTQHKKLVAILNALQKDVLVHNEKNRELLTLRFNELIDNSLLHFAIEESLCRVFNYPEADSHKMYHESSKAQVLELQKKVQVGEQAIDSQVLLFLKRWMYYHITQEDRNYGQFLLNLGFN